MHAFTRSREIVQLSTRPKLLLEGPVFRPETPQCIAQGAIPRHCLLSSVVSAPATPVIELATPCLISMLLASRARYWPFAVSTLDAILSFPNSYARIYTA